jgi:hypothetical protein
MAPRLIVVLKCETPYKKGENGITKKKKKKKLTYFVAARLSGECEVSHVFIVAQIVQHVLNLSEVDGQQQARQNRPECRIGNETLLHGILSDKNNF